MPLMCWMLKAQAVSLLGLLYPAPSFLNFFDCVNDSGVTERLTDRNVIAPTEMVSSLVSGGKPSGRKSIWAYRPL